MDAYEKLDEIVALVEGARAMPMSVSCVLNRNDLLDLLDDLRELLPDELTQARFVLADRDEVVAEGRREAERLLAEARRERARLVASTDVATGAHREAHDIVARAEEEARSLREDVEEYVDKRLAHFEVILHKTMDAVQRGRRQLARDEDGPPHPELAALSEDAPGAGRHRAGDVLPDPVEERGWPVDPEQQPRRADPFRPVGHAGAGNGRSPSTGRPGRRSADAFLR